MMPNVRDELDSADGPLGTRWRPTRTWDRREASDWKPHRGTWAWRNVDAIRCNRHGVRCWESESAIHGPTRRLGGLVEESASLFATEETCLTGAWAMRSSVVAQVDPPSWTSPAVCSEATAHLTPPQTVPTPPPQWTLFFPWQKPRSFFMRSHPTAATLWRRVGPPCGRLSRYAGSGATGLASFGNDARVGSVHCACPRGVDRGGTQCGARSPGRERASFS